MSLAEFQQRIQAAAAGGTGLRLRGGGSKDFYGNALRGEILDTRSYAGVVTYEPTELVVTARCGTSLSELEKILEDEPANACRSNPRTSVPAPPSAAASPPACPARAAPAPARCAISCSA